MTLFAPSLRELKKERTRQELAAAALRLFVARGFEAVKVEDIAAAAGVSPRTFFRYFASKEQALWPDQDRRLAEQAAVVAAGPPGESVLECLRRVAGVQAQRYEDERDEMLPRFALLHGTPALRGYLLECLEAWEEVTAAALADRFGAPPAPAALRHRLLAAAAVAAFRVAVIAWVAEDGRTPLPRLALAALDTLASDLRRRPSGP